MSAKKIRGLLFFSANIPNLNLPRQFIIIISILNGMILGAGRFTSKFYRRTTMNDMPSLNWSVNGTMPSKTTLWTWSGRWSINFSPRGLQSSSWLVKTSSTSIVATATITLNGLRKLPMKMAGSFAWICRNKPSMTSEGLNWIAILSSWTSQTGELISHSIFLNWLTSRFLNGWNRLEYWILITITFFGDRKSSNLFFWFYVFHFTFENMIAARAYRFFYFYFFFYFTNRPGMLLLRTK